MSDAAVDAEIATKDSKGVVEEAEGRRDDPADGNANENTGSKGQTVGWIKERKVGRKRRNC